VPASGLPGTVALAVALVISSGEELPLILNATSDIIYVFIFGPMDGSSPVMVIVPGKSPVTVSLLV